MNRLTRGVLGGLLVFSFSCVAPEGPVALAAVPDDSCAKGETKSDEGCVKNPKPRRKAKPVFPKEAHRKRLEGHVTLQARVMEDGSVTEIEVKNSTNPGQGFEDAAIAALKKWRYEPGTLNGKPVPVYFTVTIDFIYH